VVAIGGFAPSLSVDQGELVAKQGGTYTKTASDVLRFPRGVHNLQAVIMLGRHEKGIRRCHAVVSGAEGGIVHSRW
jgi:hypothetical protein